MSLIGDLTKVEVFRLAEYINTREKKEIIPKELFDGTVLPAAELVDTDLDPFDYFVRSGIDAEMIRNRKTINALVEEFKNMKLNPELFPPDWNDVSIYDKVTVNQFKEQCISAEKNSRNSVFKAAQAAPIVIISPRSRGFSNRETIINRYKEQI
jgi:NAD+ synthase (glutamine-hydrolysing)